MSEVSGGGELQLLAEAGEHQELLDHVEAGIVLLQSGRDDEVFSHFADYQLYGDQVKRVGGSYLQRDICGLHTEDDLVSAARLIASSNFCPNPNAGINRGLKITGCMTSDIDEKSAPNRINLAARLKREVAMLAAEEWLHALQYATDESLAGEENHEVDVLAYFIEKDCDPSLDFITRYRSRARWYTKRYPDVDTLNQVTAFRLKYGLGV